MATIANTHSHFAGRVACGSNLPVVIAKNGVHQIRRLPNGDESEVLSIGLACSECFSGANLYKILKPGLEYEMKVMENLLLNQAAAPLSIHTSGGVPEALSMFLEALEPHLPWKNSKDNNDNNNDDDDSLDWCCSLQIEGASAVWAAIDMLLQIQIIETGNNNRIKVAVGNTSYHGPPSTSLGANSPLWQKHNQLKYPTPLAGMPIDHEKLIEEFKAFLEENANDIGVILVEPQWGSSQGAFPWPKDLLKEYITMAKNYGIKVVCDEIMCGLGRHGQNTLFLSEAWDLDPDAVTFGKAIAAGCFPLSGAIIKQGRNLLNLNKATVMQSHTYAGSSVRALMAATEVLNEIPNWFPSIAKLGEEMRRIFRYISKISNGMVTCHGQGLMWGGIFSREGQCSDPQFRAHMIQVFKEKCNEAGILPYHIPVGGFMVTPVIDIDVGTIYQIGERLENVVIATMKEVEWRVEYKSPVWEVSEQSNEFFAIALQLLSQEKKPVSTDLSCLPQLHATKACTACPDFVCPTVRRHFRTPSLLDQ